MKNFLLRLSYDGTRFHGWQFQKTGERSVEGVLLGAWEKISKGEKIKLICSGRTDKGVHAYQQAANFVTGKDIDPGGIRRAFNSLLPKDVMINAVEPVVADFHARYDAKERSYLYLLSKQYSIFNRFYSYYYNRRLEVAKMREASLFLVGEHDFSAFRASGCFSPTPVRNIKAITIEEDDSFIRCRFTANAFLFRMIRIIVGTLIDVGSARLAPIDVKNILAGKDRAKAGKTAPPHGLYLEKIKYDESLFL